MDDARSSIEKTKKEFEKSFAQGEYYDKQTQDKKHLEQILSFLPAGKNMSILDLGTGTGYLGFSIAEKYEDGTVIGLDVVENALKKNTKRAEEEGLTNIRFISYDGMKFPFGDETFDLVVTRYSLHHFPIINDAFKEICRVLKPGGYLFLSDPAPNDDDGEGFADTYMRMKNDGHIKFYSQEEWTRLALKFKMEYLDGFKTAIRFPRKMTSEVELDRIMSKYDKKTISGYNIRIEGSEVYITEQVNNLLYRKSK
ncbi:MAG: class I SAM-dependent methyltransferase [Oscillospiraceae bacterium]|nr:class I SAM-dependent methyltransferase [Oscillospiraceae bacterium]